MAINQLDEFRKTMEGVPAGMVPTDRAGGIESLLLRFWGCFTGTAQGGMTADKVLTRTERMQWQPPTLSFDIERHGGTVMGSVYAEIQTWTFDLSNGRASVALGQRRLLRRRASPLNTAGLAEKIASLIQSHTDDTRLVWQSSDRVLLDIGSIIPFTNQQTTAGRRKRFIAELATRLALCGWRKIPKGSRHVFERSGE